MRKPNVAKPRSAAAAFSLSRTLPRLKLPLGAVARSVPRPYPVVGKPQSPAAVPQANPADPLCHRCGHGESNHPMRYVCDKYPHPDPLRICGCESEELEEVCSLCGHKARRHKPRHRCRDGSCKCWAFEACPPC